MATTTAHSASITQFAKSNPDLITAEWSSVKGQLTTPAALHIKQQVENGLSQQNEDVIQVLTQALAQYKLFPDVDEFVDTLSLGIKLKNEEAVSEKPAQTEDAARETLWMIPVFNADKRMAERKNSLLAFKKKVENAHNQFSRPSSGDVEAKVASTLRLNLNALHPSFSGASPEQAAKLNDACKTVFSLPKNQHDQQAQLFQMPVGLFAGSSSAPSAAPSLDMPRITSFTPYAQGSEIPGAFPVSPVTLSTSFSKDPSPVKSFNSTKKDTVRKMFKKPASKATPLQEAPTPIDLRTDGTVLIKTLTGKTITLHPVNLFNAKVSDLMAMIRKQEGILESQQRLIFAGKLLQEDKIFNTYYGATNGCTIHLVLRLRGDSKRVDAKGANNSLEATSSSGDPSLIQTLQQLAQSSAPRPSQVASPVESLGHDGDLIEDYWATEHGEWRWYQSLLVRGAAPSLSPASKVAAFDMDQTLIKVASGGKFPRDAKDWKWLSNSVVPRIKLLMAQGYRIVIFTNQAGIKTGQQKEGDITAKISEIAKQLGESPGNPILALVPTDKDKYRKPSPRLWDFFIHKVNGGVRPEAFFVGDAAGRASDHSCADRFFAQNVGIPFITQDLFFPVEYAIPTSLDVAAMITLSQAVQWPAEVDPAITDLKSKASQGIVSAYDIPPTTAPLEIVLMCGKPGSGKSTIFQTVFAPLGYVHVNLDTEKSTEKCKKKATATLQSRTSIVVDQTFPSKKSRADYVQLARSFNIPIRIICVETPISVALHLNTIRSWLYDIPHVPTIAYRLFDKQFEKPTLNEGFSEVINLPFKITVADPVLLKAIQWSTERG